MAGTMKPSGFGRIAGAVFSNSAAARKRFSRTLPFMEDVEDKKEKIDYSEKEEVVAPNLEEGEDMDKDGEAEVVKSYPCEKCDATFDTPIKKAIHMRAHGRAEKKEQPKTE